MFESLIAIAVALIGGLFVIFQLIIAKYHKISEFRKEWIEKVHEEFGNAASAIKAYNEGKADKKDDNFCGALRNIQKILNWIGLMQKEQKDEDLSKLKKNLEALDMYLRKDYEPQLEEKQKVAEIGSNKEDQDTSLQQWEVLLENAKDNIDNVLSSEWEKIKKGEPVFKSIAIYPEAFLGLLTVISIFIVIVIVFHSCNKEGKATPGNSIEFSVISQKSK